MSGFFSPNHITTNLKDKYTCESERRHAYEQK